MNETKFFSEGKFYAGCNYWASHAGMFMWSDWRPEVVAADFEQMKEFGLKVLRVFPLWNDFQPIKSFTGCYGRHIEYGIDEIPLADSPSGRAGVSEEMMKRFRFLADQAADKNMKLAVGLLTGWMSGRFFVPPALEKLNVITDPVALMWEVRFVKYFVNEFKDHPAIAAWDLGNECNCMGEAKSRAEAWNWASSIVNAIRAVDNSRPVLSGMHSLGLSGDKKWNICDQSELCDMLTTHPYPRFTPNCDLDPVNTIRNGLHATAESRYYGDVGNCPCMVEEIGTLAPMICNDKTKADYVRTSLFSSWAHDCISFLWWCAYDQDHLSNAPYDWNVVERELGLFKNDRKPKEVACVMRDFSKFLEKIPTLPKRSREAVCILSEGQVQWDAAYGAFILAKQAGFDIEFQYVSQNLKESDFYMMPSVAGGSSMPLHRWLALLDKIRKGATLYLSIDDCLLSGFDETFGLQAISREKRTADVTFSIDSIENVSFKCSSSFRLNLETLGAKVLGTEEDGNPLFSVYEYGKGKIYLLTVPLESCVAVTAGVLHKDGALPYWKIYERMAVEFTMKRILEKSHPMLGITEHEINKNERIAVLINYSPEKIKSDLKISAKWKITEIVYGSKPEDASVSIAANDAVVLKLAAL